MWLKLFVPHERTPPFSTRLFSMTKQERDNIRAKYKAKVPDPLNRQFPERASKDKAIKRHEACKELRTELFPSGKVITKI